ncbi:exocyst complex component EXO70H1-like [Macadamia integrifolia]|uniref:exocyst complex component EXO70H1-like n=1 Tax=Macadamia integrifolia TaxID=60698 RepID=UPI001C4E49A2|nr:exocyst complex component EXO70H1-like [Macadamia integrifolia]
MPFKGLRTVFFTFSNDSSITSSSSSSRSPYNPSPLSTRPSTPLHTFSESMIEENVERAKSIITKWDPNSSTFAKVTSLFYESRSEAKEFIKSVNQLQEAMQFFVSHSSSSDKLVQAQHLMQVAMKRLEKEFYQILSSNRDHLDPESVSARSSISEYEDEASTDDEIQLAGESISEVEKFSTLAMSDLNSIAECMISCGYGKECVKIYKIMRKSIVDEALYKLGVDCLTSSQINKMEWEVLELKIKSWLKAVKIAVKSLFHGEKIVCDQVFTTSHFIWESCFSDITKEGAVRLFRFPESVAKCHKSPEKIFRMLDLYDAIAELWSDIDSIFSYDSTSVVRSQALNSLTRLGDTVRAMLSEFESAIQKDSSKSPVPGGALHPLTRYVMNYLSLLTDYSAILSDILANCPLPVNMSLPESYFEIPNPNDNPLSVVATRMAWIILAILCKLDAKARLYKDSALAYLFLANNHEYVLQKVQTSYLSYLLGEDWISKHKATVKQYAASYERIGWSDVLSAIPDDPTATTMTIEEAKECFNNFNSAFERTYRTQSNWVVKDRKLREEIKVSIAGKLVPAYGELYRKYRDSLRSENEMESVVRFAPDDLGNYLSDLFFGTGASGSASSLASSTAAQSGGKHFRERHREREGA